MTFTSRKLALIAIGATAMTLSLSSSSVQAKTKTPVVAVGPFLCNTASDGSAVGFINKQGKALLYVNLVDDTDYGGAIMSNMATVDGTTAKITVSAIPTSTTGNLGLKLAVASTMAGASRVFTVSPTSLQNKGNYSVVTFDFSKYGLPEGTQITKVADLVTVSTTDAGGGSVYLYNYTINGTVVSKRVLTEAGCLSY